MNKKEERASTGKRIVMVITETEEPRGGIVTFFFEGETQTLHFPPVVRAG